MSKLPLPDSLDGMRCLDVGTQNGFWAFELERRAATPSRTQSPNWFVS